MAEMNLSIEKKQTHGHGEETCSCQGEGGGVGGTGSLRLVDANYCIWNEYPMRSCCIAQGSVSKHLWWNMIEDNVRKKIYVCITWSPCCAAEIDRTL